jgi:hypothetical protein
MKIAFTAMNTASIINVLDFDTGKVQSIPTPAEAVSDHRPFGITWDNSHIFVANPTKIVALDKNLDFKKIVVRDLWYGTHQILCKEDSLFMVSPRIDGINRYNLRTKEMSYFLPFHKNNPKGKWRAELPLIFKHKDKNNFSYDIHHFNSILIKDDRLYLSAHNYTKPSFITVFKYPEMEEIERIENTGIQMHGIGVVRDEVFWLDSSGHRALKSNKGLHIKIGDEVDFVRGMVITDDWIIVAYFPYDPYVRLQRKEGHSQIVAINRKNNQVERHFLISNVGNINDMRVLDEFDYAHYNQPFWSK